MQKHKHTQNLYFCALLIITITLPEIEILKLMHSICIYVCIFTMYSTVLLSRIGTWGRLTERFYVHVQYDMELVIDKSMAIMMYNIAYLTNGYINWICFTFYSSILLHTQIQCQNKYSSYFSSRNSDMLYMHSQTPY